MTSSVSMLCALNSFMMSRNCHRTRVHFVSMPACARARCAHENVHHNGAGRDVWLRRAAHAPTMRGASAYLVVNLRLPLELYLDLAQIRDGVLSRWAAGCHGHGTARERALRFVLAARIAHRRSKLGAGTLHRGVVEGGGAGGNVAVWHSPRSAVCSSAALVARAKPPIASSIAAAISVRSRVGEHGSSLEV